MNEVLISTAFLFALRQSAGETPAIRWSVNRFKIDPQITQIRRDYFRDKWDKLLDHSRDGCVSFDEFFLFFIFVTIYFFLL
ncbi:MAG: hypothetical protein LBP59_02100 [Planctomycetaceae bacterium]|nr:hypothetical protein [Planctomycetaceae bacterium]